MRLPFRKGRPVAASRGRPLGRALAAEVLEPRNLLTVLLANRLDDVTVTATGALVAQDNLAPDPAGQVLVINGTSGSDTISVQRSVSTPGAIDVIFNKVRTTYATPIEAIVAHGVAGNDTISVDPSLQISAFLFGGAGNDKLTGGAGDDVLVGGGGSNVLQGGAGRDVLIGSTGTNSLYGNTSAAPAAADGDNFLVAGSLGQDFNLPFLRNLASLWTADSPHDARIAAIQSLLGPAVQPGGSKDQLYPASDADWMFAASGNGNLVQVSTLLANRLDSVIVTASGLSIRTQSGPSDPAGPVLVVNGTAGNDVISVQPSATIPGAIDVILNGKRTTYATPLSAIVAHVGNGNDTLTVDPNVAINAFVFGGNGNDKLTGGAGNDVLVGGSGTDVLQGGAGSDLLIAGTGTAQLYGSSAQSTGAADGENVLIGEASSQQFNLPFLQSLIGTWAGSDTHDARVAALNSALGPTLQPNSNHDALYASSAADLAIASPTKSDQVWFAEPGIRNGWFSGPTTTANGFSSFNVQSPYQRTVNSVRVLLPAGYNAGQTYSVMYVLPVEAGLSTTYGDGLATIKSLSLQNTYTNTIFVAPSFSELPWYANNATTSTIWEETYFTQVIVPMIDTLYPTQADASGRMLLGFSKSGYGAWTLLMRHPDLFGRALAWDSPLGLTSAPSGAGWGFAENVGTQQNFTANYQITRMLTQNASWLKTQPPRLYMMGYALDFTRTMTIQVDQQMTSLGIPHVFPALVNYGNHSWNSGWVSTAVRLLET